MRHGLQGELTVTVKVVRLMKQIQANLKRHRHNPLRASLLRQRR